MLSDPGQKARVRDSDCAGWKREGSTPRPSVGVQSEAGPGEELCRVPEGQKDKGGQESMKRGGLKERVKGAKGDGRNRAGRPPGKAESTPLPSLIHQTIEQTML